MVDIQKHIEAKYDTTEKIAAHTSNAELFAILHNDIAAKNKKEQQFFAYIVTQIEALLAKYTELVILRDIDDTICHRIKPEESEHYDVIRSGLLPTLEYLTKKHPTQLEFGILSRRPRDFLQQTFVHKTNPDRPQPITNHFNKEHIFSSRGFGDEKCPTEYHCLEHKNLLVSGHYNKANAYDEIIRTSPERKYILIDDIIGFGIKYKAKMDRHIPFPIALVMGEEDAIMQR